MTTRKQFEDALKALVGLVPDADNKVNPWAIRLDNDGLHLGTVSATPQDWTMPDTVYAWPKELKALAKEFGKPGDPIGELQVVDGRFKAAGVTLDELTKHDATEPTSGAPTLDKPRQVYNTEDVVAVSKAATRDDMRPVLTCVRFATDAVLATDSYRLYLLETQGQPEAEELNIPEKIIRAIGSLKPETFELGFHDIRSAAVSFTTPSGVEVSGTIDTTHGQFPKYQQLFPEAWDIKTTLTETDTTPTKAAEKVGRWTTGNRPVILTFNGRCNISTVASSNNQVDPTPISTPTQVRKKNGEPVVELPVDIGVNPTFLLEAIKYSGEDSDLFAISPLRPVMLKKNNRRALLMPIRLKEEENQNGH